MTFFNQPNLISHKIKVAADQLLFHTLKILHFLDNFHPKSTSIPKKSPLKVGLGPSSNHHIKTFKSELVERRALALQSLRHVSAVRVRACLRICCDVRKFHLLECAGDFYSRTASYRALRKCSSEQTSPIESKVVKISWSDEKRVCDSNLTKF